MVDKSRPDAEKPSTPDEIPAAGPHAKPELMDDEKTPGTGALPDTEGGEVDPGSE